MGCWNETQVAAAKVRDLQSRLMVATLRCRAMGVDVPAAYNHFVARQPDDDPGRQRRAHGAVPRRLWRPGADSITTASRPRSPTYGADATDRAVCAETAALAEEAAAADGDIAPAGRRSPTGSATSPALPGRRSAAISFASAEAAATSRPHIKISLYLHSRAVAARGDRTRPPPSCRRSFPLFRRPHVATQPQTTFNDYVDRRHRPRRLRPQGDRDRRDRDAGPDGAARGIRRVASR